MLKLHRTTAIKLYPGYSSAGGRPPTEQSAQKPTVSLAAPETLRLMGDDSAYINCN